MTFNTTLLLAAGSCLTTTGSFEKCALQPSECTFPELYRSAGWSSSSNNDAMDVARQCSAQESIRRLQSMGRCDGIADRHICTSDKTACRFSAVFSPLTKDCNLVEDFLSTNSFSNAHYGFCISEDSFNNPSLAFCAWKFHECGKDLDLYRWHEADMFGADSFPVCHCDDVRTGACLNSNNGNDLYCAVTKETCEGDDGYVYLPVLELESQRNVTCKLCDTLPPGSIKGRTDVDGRPGSDGDSTTQEQNNNNNDVVGKESTETDVITESEGVTDSEALKMSEGAIAGISVGAVVGVAFLFIGAAIISKYYRKPDVSDAETIGSLPSVQ